MKLLFALLLSCASFAASAQAALKIGYVDSERVQREAGPAKAAQARLEAEFGKRQKELSDQSVSLHAQEDKLDKDAPTLSESEKGRRQRELVEAERDLQRRGRQYQEDYSQRVNEERFTLADHATRVIKQIGESEHYDLILTDQTAVYYSPRVDITQKVIDALNASK